MGSRIWLGELRLLVGFEQNRTSHGEKIISALGALLGILAVAAVSGWMHQLGLLDAAAGYLVVMSIGASAVLLFAVPQGALSQPWPLLAGHLLSAFIGVTCFQLLQDSLWSAALAVGLAIGAMHYCRCIHPPGGATALTAVLGGVQVHELGYFYLLAPILLNVLVILLAAIVFNSLFAWRRYPAHLARKHKVARMSQPPNRQFELTQEDFSAAMQELDSYVDITAEGLTELLELAKQHAEKNITHPAEIVAGKFYSNGKLGRLWSVRQVVDESTDVRPANDKIIFKVVAGDQSYITDICLRDEFRQWARFEVEKRDNRWVKLVSEG
ncbi:MAG: HPP domain-containing protein [Gammaproteobacteria bacterium]|nr:HPP domain-containing protein [Gammaproteobacteria bacterium]